MTRAADWLYVDPFVRSSEDSERRLSPPPTRAGMGVKDGSPKDGTAPRPSIDGALVMLQLSPMRRWWACGHRPEQKCHLLEASRRA